jgi:hypothetical protein
VTRLAWINVGLMAALIAHTVDHAVNQPAREIPASAGFVGVAGFVLIGISAVLAIRRSSYAAPAAVAVGALTVLGIVAVHLAPGWWDFVSDPYWDFSANALTWLLALAPLAGGIALAAEGLREIADDSVVELARPAD